MYGGFCSHLKMRGEVMKINKLVVPVSASAIFFAVAICFLSTDARASCRPPNGPCNPPIVHPLIPALMTSVSPDFSWYSLGQTNFTISTANQLAGLAEIVNGTWSGSPVWDNFTGKTVTLAADINLSGFAVGEGWMPIGTYTGHYDNKPFSGTFDGGGKTISNLTVNRSNTSYVGLFGFISGATVKNIGLENVDITGFNNVGGIVGAADYNSSITNCYSTGTVGATGLTGYVGGVAGAVRNNSSVANSYSTSAVSSIHYFVGGVAGFVTDESSVANCYSTGLLSGRAVVGGVVGRFQSVSTSVSDNAALNPEVAASEAGPNSGRAGRVVASTPNGVTLSNNAAFDGMEVTTSATDWPNIGADDLDGADITIAQIHADGTIGGRFTAAGGWTAENGKLPGLFGRTVEMPEHLSITTSVRYPSRQHSTSAQFVKVSGRTLNMRMTERGRVDIYALNGARVRTFDLNQGTHTLRLNSLPRGMYVVKAQSGAWKQSARVLVK